MPTLMWPEAADPGRASRDSDSRRGGAAARPSAHYYRGWTVDALGTAGYHPGSRVGITTPGQLPCNLTLMPISLSDELSAAVTAARAAGAAAMRFYGSTTSVAKADASPVTAADHAANDVIVARLGAAFPGDAILSEESADSRARLSAHRVWIVDPLDGTKEFLAQNGEFSIMIGLAIEGGAVLGVVYLPAIDVLYAAAQGEGAWVEREGKREPLLRAAADVSALRLVGSRSHAEPLVERLQQALGITDVAPCGSVGVKCTRIAHDERDLYLHPVPYLKEWDTCAPEAILREAGGSVTDCMGEPLRYNKPDPRQPHGIMACAPGVYEAAMGEWRGLYASR